MANHTSLAMGQDEGFRSPWKARSISVMPVSLLKVLAKRSIARPARWLLGRRHLREPVVRHLSRFPSLDARARMIVRGVSRPTLGSQRKRVPRNLRDLPESARDVFVDLQRAVDRQCGG
jgi:hypothetical protein